MTCIVAIKSDEGVWLAADSGEFGENDRHVGYSSKLFRLLTEDGHDIVVGHSGSNRVCQLMKGRLALPARGSGPLDLYMTTHFVDALRKVVREGGVMEIKDEVESFASELLVAAEGRIFHVWGDFSVTENTRMYEAAGAAARYALGAMRALSDTVFALEEPPNLEPLDIARAAIICAEEFSVWVLQPIVTMLSAWPIPHQENK